MHGKQISETASYNIVIFLPPPVTSGAAIEIIDIYYFYGCYALEFITQLQLYKLK
jgi:hypothetical protein